MGLRVCLVFLLTVSLVGPYVLAGLGGKRARRGIAWLWYAGLLKLGGIEVRVVGRPRRGGSTFYVANHVSYLDIVVLGRVLDGLFVAKSDVASWPGIGLLARLAGTVFVRRSLEMAREQCAELTEIMDAGDNIILFPEGTSGLGDTVMPFKTTLFEVPYRVKSAVGLRIQPLAIVYIEADRKPCRTRRERSLVAWYGRMTLVPHVLRFLGTRGAVVELHFLEPIRAEDFSWRRDLAVACRERISDGLVRALSR